jgi:lipoprotein-releasing system permease protein
MLGVALGLTSLIIVLSVFNGLEDLNRQIFKAYDPDLKIFPSKSKNFTPSQNLVDFLKTSKAISHFSEVYEDKALARGESSQMIVTVKGVDQNFLKNNDLKNSLIEGEMKIFDDFRAKAFIGGGVYSILNLGVNDFLNPLSLLYPKNNEINVLYPEQNINQQTLEVSGVFVLEQQYDNLVIVPLKTVEALTELSGKRTAIEITLKDGFEVEKLKNEIEPFMADELQIKNRDEQNASLLKAIKIEKLFIFIALFFIIGIASFNIFYALTMLVIDKKDDIQTLSSLGAKKHLVRNIFLTEGLIISGIGVVLGLFLGLGICLIQLKFGIVKLGMEYAMVDSYPVKIIFSDIVYSLIGIVLITLIASLIPAYKAQKFMLAE